MPNSIVEARYQLAILSHHVFRNDKDRAKLGGLAAAPFLKMQFSELLGYPLHYRRTDADIRDAVNLWCKDSTAAEIKYGNISDWDTSRVTNMDKLFYRKDKFNDDISTWDVSSCTSMEWMFFDAANFDQGEWMYLCMLESYTIQEYSFAACLSVCLLVC